MTNWVELETVWGPHLVDLDRVYTICKDPEIDVANPNGSILWFGEILDEEGSNAALLQVRVPYEDMKILLTGDRLTKIVRLGISSKEEEEKDQS